MKSLLIQYAVLFSKSNQPVAAMLASKAAQHAGNWIACRDLIVETLDELEAHAPKWLQYNFRYHLAQLEEKKKVYNTL